MKNKIVLIPTYNPIEVGDILVINNNPKLRSARSYDKNIEDAKGHYLYLLSNEKLVVGDYFLNGDSQQVYLSDSQHQVDWINNNTTDCSHCKKILASTNHNDGTPNLGSEMVNAYIDYENQVNNFRA